MKKQYKIKYLGAGHTIDVVEARYPKEAVKILMNPKFFIAEEVEKLPSHKELQKEFDKKVKELQKTCKHPKISDWMEIWWAIGHSTGNECRCCKFCNFQTHTRGVESVCPKCKAVESQYYIDCNKCHVQMKKQYAEINEITGEKKITSCFIPEKSGSVVTRSKYGGSVTRRKTRTKR